LQRLGFMGKALTILAALAALAGCYNPRFPSEDATAAPHDPPPDNIVRDRRDSAAGSGSSNRPN
jgi:hypothetical protein